MSTRTELHFHLLPGVDDGPRDMGDTLELARLAIADGTRTITTTPHVRDAILAEIPGRVADVRAALRDDGIALTVHTGAELAHTDLPRLSDADLDAIAQGPAGRPRSDADLGASAQGRPARRWVLLEAPLAGGDVDGLRAGLAEVRERGFGVLLAHPERCAELMQADGVLDAELARGARAQVNATSLLGRHGDDARAWALDLVRSGRAHVLASDAHRPARGPVRPPAVAELASQGVDPARAERLVADHPRALLERGLAASTPARRAA